MKPPIFVYESKDLDIFASVTEAEEYLEAIDVKNNIFVAYDSEGRLLNLSVITKPDRRPSMFDILLSRKSVTEYVLIQEAEPETSHANELRHILIDYLSIFGDDSNHLQSASLQELVEKSVERYRAR